MPDRGWDAFDCDAPSRRGGYLLDLTRPHHWMIARGLLELTASFTRPHFTLVPLRTLRGRTVVPLMGCLGFGMTISRVWWWLVVVV